MAGEAKVSAKTATVAGVNEVVVLAEKKEEADRGGREDGTAGWVVVVA